MRWRSMLSEREDLSRLIACPHCGLHQKVTFVYSAVSVEQRCIGCDKYAWFSLPSIYQKLSAWLRGRGSA
jgi:transcription elongation factor Elf1